MIETNMPLAQLADEVSRKFREHYGRAPRWIAAAPGRVNLIGEHTDYNDGFVFPMAIERYTVIAADQGKAAGGDPCVNWRCARTQEDATFPLSRPVPNGPPRHWTNYIRGVFAGAQAAGLEPGPLDVLMISSVPLGSGLSSSAALEVGTATLIEAVVGKTMDPVQKALLCQRAEHDYAGMPCGIMDQFVSTLGRAGHLLLLDCRSHATQLVPLADPSLAVLIVNTNVKHELTGGGYARRRQQCEEAAQRIGVRALRDASPEQLEQSKAKLDEVVFRRARHVIGEIERTTLAAEGCRVGNWPTVGQLMYASHYSLKEDYEVSCPELDAVVEIAQDIGAGGGIVGCRMTGGGFGGCAVALVQAERLPDIGRRIFEDYLKRTGIKPALFVSRPADGAAVVRVP